MNLRTWAEKSGLKKKKNLPFNISGNSRLKFSIIHSLKVELDLEHGLITDAEKESEKLGLVTFKRRSLKLVGNISPDNTIPFHTSYEYII